MRTLILTALLSLLPFSLLAAENSAAVTENTAAENGMNDAAFAAKTEQLKEPMYNPFIERYMLDELKKLREQMHAVEVSLTKEVVDREIRTVDKVTTYATDTVTYFFYLIAGVSSVLVMLGWHSIRDIKEKVHDLADSKVNEIVATYEARLDQLEKVLNKRSQGIQDAQKNLEQHQDIHTLWLKAAQENSVQNKIAIYDQILELDPENVEAMTYKADAVLEQNEPWWAVNLCQKALKLDPMNAHAFYQLAGGFAMLDKPTEALDNLEQYLKLSESSGEQIEEDEAFANLIEQAEFKSLLAKYQKTTKS